jgi:hypothetical protein
LLVKAAHVPRVLVVVHHPLVVRSAAAASAPFC